MRYILNTAVIGRPGHYEYRLLTELEAEAWLRQGRFVSRVAYREAAQLIQDRFDVRCPLSREHGIAPAPKRSQKTTWKEFIQSHMAVLAGIDFFTVEVLTWRGLVTYYVLFFMHLESRRVSLAGITRHPDEAWMQQVARNATDEGWGYLDQRRYVLHDRDTKFCASFQTTLTSGGIKPIQLPARSPNLNAFAERWVRSVKQECLSKLILFGEASLRRALSEFVEHFHAERNHQGKGNVLLFPCDRERHGWQPRSFFCRERLGGLLKYYGRAA